MTNGGIFGPKESGKTTLAIALSRQYWATYRVRTLCLDPYSFQHNWGEQALVESDSDKFWGMVWQTHGSLIVADEATFTINRDRDLTKVFTSLRHCGHRLLVVGHSGMNLLPMQREQLDTLYLFRQPEDAAKVWARVFAQRELLDAQHLSQYDFLFTSTYSKPRKLRLNFSP